MAKSTTQMNCASEELVHSLLHNLLLYDLQYIVFEYATPLSVAAKRLLDEHQVLLAEDMFQDAILDSSEPNIDTVMYDLAMIYAFLVGEEHKNIDLAKNYSHRSTSYKCSSLCLQLEWTAELRHKDVVPTEDIPDGGYFRYMQCATTRLSEHFDMDISVLETKAYKRFLVEHEKIKVMVLAGDARAMDLINKVYSTI